MSEEGWSSDGEWAESRIITGGLYDDDGDDFETDIINWYVVSLAPRC